MNGGILDRIDGIVFVFPILYFLILLFNFNNEKKIAILVQQVQLESKLDVIKNYKNNFDIVLITNKNISEIHKQLKIFKPKHLIITNLKNLNISKK